MSKYFYYINDTEVDEDTFVESLHEDARIDTPRYSDYFTDFEGHLDFLETNANEGITEPQDIGYNSYYMSLATKSE